MRLSVVLPVRDGAERIAEAIGSVLAQAGLPSLEMIVVDDGSTDGSAAAARRACPEAIVLTTSGVGPAAARNAGLAAATGDVIGFIDHDDLWPPGKVARQIAAFKDEAVDIVGGETLVEWASGAEIRHVLRPGIHDRLVNVGIYLMRRRVFDRLGGFDEGLRFAEDLDLFSRAEEAGLKIQMLPVPALVYRIHGRNMTCGRDGRGLGMFDAIRRRLARRDGASHRWQSPETPEPR